MSTGDFRQNVINKRYKKITAADMFNAVREPSNGIHKNGRRWITAITRFFDRSLLFGFKTISRRPTEHKRTNGNVEMP
jgi:hypothetical protein